MVAIVGRGNVASHLFIALKDKVNVCLVNPHSLEGLPEKPEFILLAVSDNAIEEIVKKLPSSDSIIAHTSGSISIDSLKEKGKNYGVFYPLQTFTKGIELDYSEIPVFIEGSNSLTISKLKKLASLFTNDIREADSEARRKLHLASVFACNFTNALAGVGKDLLEGTNIDFSALLPLMKQTVNKLQYLSPSEAQTGPAVRGDSIVMQKHLRMLQSNPLLQDIYNIFSTLILNNHVSQI